MKLPCLHSWWILSSLCHGILLLLMSSGLESAKTASAYSNVSDLGALLDFKNLITQDPFEIMSSWNDSIHFCNWVGVLCTESNQRVEVLNLASRRLAGSIPPSIGNLTHLTGINLRNNSFHGELPQEMGRLRHLQHINPTNNNIGGKIPTNLTHCAELTVFDVAYNSFVGEIPDQLSSLSKVVMLILGANNLTGSIPSWIGNFSSLFALSLAINNFHGSIPIELGRLTQLGIFHLYGNYLSGTIPPSIYNISSIYFFSVTQNQLHGQLPPDVGLTLPRLQIFAGGVNSFTGTIPSSLSNASELQVLDFAINGLAGPIPRNLGNLKYLTRLNFDDNNLGKREVGNLNFLSSLTNCTSLQVLGFARNRFGGTSPSSIANLSTQLQILTLGQNLIRGSIPFGIGNLVNLNLLGLEGNYLSGSVPDVIGKLHQLGGLHLHFNRFSGSIPSTLGNLTRLTRLFLEENRFEGGIPPSLGSCQNLLNLNLSCNNLSGAIPKQVLGLSSFSIALVMSNNSLSGHLPSEVGDLVNLAELDLSDNELSGEIPSTLDSCISLERLRLEGNKFEGAVPESLKTLRGIQELDLSRNNLSGKIPEFLSKLLSITYLNLSYNNFEGEVSKEGIFANTTAISLTGNNKLCGGIPQLLLPPCFKERNRKRLTVRTTLLIVTVILVILPCAIAILYIVRKSRTRRRSRALTSDESQSSMSFSELMKSTDGLAAENLIGSGSFGSVYKGVLSGDGKIVAIKVLNLQQQGASRSFIDECKALRSIRHRNLLKIITACSTVDHQGNDVKALVFEFMSNGNLDQWLHRRVDEQYQTERLSLAQRLNIAIDVAAALDYLHHHCETPIVHCDLKPSNVLLDEDMTAHVGDFGLARFLFEASKHPADQQPISIALKGSVGYIPPEYGMGARVSTLGDVYSYGILLLEMFTGKRPTDDMFADHLSIDKFVSTAMPNQVTKIIDESMLVGEENERDELFAGDCVEERAITRDSITQASTRSKVEECLVSVMEIGLSCSEKSPGKRMDMNAAVKKLQGIRDSLLRSMNNSRRKK